MTNFQRLSCVSSHDQPILLNKSHESKLTATSTEKGLKGSSHFVRNCWRWWSPPDVRILPSVLKFPVGKIERGEISRQVDRVRVVVHLWLMVIVVESFCAPEEVKVFFRLFTSWHRIQILFNDDNRWLVLSDRPWVWKRKFRAMTGVMYEFWHKSANHLSKTCSTKGRHTRSFNFDKMWLTFKKMSYVQYFLKQ